MRSRIDFSVGGGIPAAGLSYAECPRTKVMEKVHGFAAKKIVQIVASNVGQMLVFQPFEHCVVAAERN